MNRAEAHLAAREIQLERSSTDTTTFHGTSMQPFLRDGDGLAIEPVEWDDIRVGDIVTYRLDARFPTYRVVRRFPRKLVLRGDGWVHKDVDVWPDDVCGRVVARGRAGQVVRRGDWRWRFWTYRAIADDRARRLGRRARSVIGRLRRAGIRVARSRWLGYRDAPAGLHVNISADCNLRCRMCGYLAVHRDATYTRTMSLESFRALNRVLRVAPALHLVGAGEPLLNPELVSIVRHARAANRQLEIDLTTNGMLLDASLIERLIDAGLDRLIVSIDGGTPDTVEAIRVGIDFPRVIEAIGRVTRVKQDRGSRLPILRVNYVVGYGSYDELPRFVRLARSLGVQELNLLEAHAGTKASWHENLANSIRRDGGACLRDAVKIAQDAGMKVFTQMLSGRGCLAPSTPHVAEGGAISPCCFLDYYGRTFYLGGEVAHVGPLTHGSLRTTAFEAIWDDPTYRGFRERTGRGQLSPDCQVCYRARALTSDALKEALASS